MPETVPAEQRTAEVRAFLAGLGTTKDEVAASLAKLGAKGRRVKSMDCPIANALTANFPDTVYVSISRFGIYIEYGPGREVMTVDDVPGPIQEFITAFDEEGAYPELVVETAAAQS